MATSLSSQRPNGNRLAPAPIDTDHSVSARTDEPDSPEQAFETPLSSPHTQMASLPTGVQQATQTEAPKQDAPTPDHATLTPLRAHYLKKQLIHLQFQHELDALVAAPANNISSLSYLGPPFNPPPKDAPRLELPFLKYCFRRFVLSFPFLAAAPRDFFPEKLQPFLVSMLSRNLSSSSPLDHGDEDSEEAMRHKLLAKLERNAAMLLTSGTKLVEKEEVVRLTQADLDRLETVAKKRAARERELKDLFEVNVVCVRAVTEKGRMRSRIHEEFIVRTRRRHHPDVFVSRRYGDFKTLAAELRKAHPGEIVPAPPAKDRTIVNMSSSTSPNPSIPTSPLTGMYVAGRNASADSFDSGSLSPTSPNSQMPGSPSPGMTFTSGAARLAREKNRLTLRAYLHSLLAQPVFASSPVLRSFLLSGPTTLTPEELEDAKKREEADQVREDGRKRFAKEIAARVDGLREAAKNVRGELLAKDGLTHIFATIKETEDIRKLPDSYQAVLEWARVSLASTVFQHFVAADNASENFAGLKRIHGLMPYFMLKTVLKVSNPMAMIRGVLDLFLATPFGGRSLLQRMFTGSLLEEVKAIEEDIDAIKDKVDDPILCEKVKQFMYAPREIQAVYKADAASEDIHILAAVLRSGEEPALSRAQIQRVMYAHRAHKEYIKYTETLQDSDDDEGPQDEEAWLFEDLAVLAQLYTRLRDREQLIELIFEGTTADLLKDIITIFYTPLAQVYRAASIADSLGDLQNFVNDLIRTVEQTEELSQSDPAKTVQIYIDLIKRHEQAFYSFVHKVHSKGEGLFTDLMRWIELFLTLMRDGLGERISIEFLLPHTGQEREEIIKEVDAIALYHYKLKVAYQDKVRKRFGRTQGLNDADAEDEVTAEMVGSVMRDLSFGELVQDNAEDLAAEETDTDDEYTDDDDSSEFDSSSGSSGRASVEDATEREVTPHRRSPPASASTPSDAGSPSPTVKRSRTIAHVIGHVRSASKQKNQASDSASERGSTKLRHSRSLIMGCPPQPRSPAPTPKSAPATRRSMSKSRPQHVPKKNKAPELKPPELKHIPQLLPIFMEVMKPLLRVPTRT